MTTKQERDAYHESLEKLLNLIDKSEHELNTRGARLGPVKLRRMRGHDEPDQVWAECEVRLSLTQGSAIR